MAQETMNKTDFFGNGIEEQRAEERVYILDEKEIREKSLDLSGYDKLYIKGVQTIRCDCPIIAPENLTICGDPGSKLFLYNTEECQPCIGGKAHTGMSYGRWSPAPKYVPKTLHIEVVEIACESVIKNFTIGSYNYDKLTDIVVSGGGKLYAPEMCGTRHLLEEIFPPSGSTKISRMAEYTITPIGEDYVRPYTPEQEAVLNRIKAEGYPTNRISSEINESDMKKILKYLRLGMDVSPVYDNYSKVKGNVGIYLGALYVGVDKDSEILMSNIGRMRSMGILAEMEIDSLKQKAVLKKIVEAEEMDPKLAEELKNDSKDLEQFLRHFARTRLDFESLSEIVLQTWWELIPSYLYSNQGSVLADVIEYYSE